MTNSSLTLQSHSLPEDLFALISGTAFVAFGVFLFNGAGLLTGGTAGLALLLTHVLHISFGKIFFLLNLPFYWLAFKQMGWRFCLNTFISVAIVSLVVDHTGDVVSIKSIEPWFAAVFGGFLIGMGMLILFRHKSSLGGVGILALYLQKRNIMRAGKFQMMVDCIIVLASCFIVTPMILLYSVLGAVALNLLLTVNHKPGRYQVG
ncbi:uncharacterized conserved protein [Hahella chejuensis KCTC 2396]|uniref:Uncharacterized conserved protein n=1 Tax=Hahella chejuensis (strain KCTC 2396) TaxID=349521 RepID=Q2SI35_HAHCH|nr:YitT family protein [Hahella chejuensis]ABC29689.1 uncharacterized conserved protein [Hahella chejuensis KCTC 2396]